MRLLFISAMSGCPWGGSEELWSQSAMRLAEMGHQVLASVQGWPDPPSQLARLRRSGVAIRERPHGRTPLVQRILLGILRKCGVDAQKRQMYRLLKEAQANLAIISTGGMGDGLGWQEACVAAGQGYACVTQANAECWWPTDQLAQRLGVAYRKAAKAFFVSTANQRLFELQVGEHAANAKVVRNPFSVPYNIQVPWPDESSYWRLACVGRLEPPVKGQDLLIEVLAKQKWRQRPIRLDLYGLGPMAGGISKMISMMQLEETVVVRGFESNVEEIWRDHHALVLASRYEGLPLAIVEAMLCGRPCIVTDVAGNAELVDDNISGFVAAAPTAPLIDEALERAWQRRNDWRQIGLTAGARVRQSVPADPVGVFCEELLGLARA